MNSGYQTISVESSWLPDPSGKPPVADRQRANVYREVLRRDPPGGWSSNRYLLSQQYVGTQYVAIKATWSWLAGSTVIVERERTALTKSHRVRKATQPGGLGNDSRYHPVPSGDPLAALFEYVNSVDTFQDFIAQLVIQIMLTGNAHIWMPRNAGGRPCEMWVLPSVMLQNMLGAFSPNYPFGGYRLNPTYGTGWSGIGIPAVGNVPLDAREVIHYREPHAFLRQDGYGATQAMARQIDVLNGVETSRAASMAKGVRKDVLVTLEGATDMQVKDLQSDLNRLWGGADNHGGVGVIGADKANVNELNQAPKDMDYPAGWEQSGRSVLAGYRIPPVVAGIIEANYAEFWAAVRAWFAGELKPFATRFSATLTKHVAQSCYGPDYRVRLQLPPIEDPDLLIQQHSFTPNDLFTVNEHRAAMDVEPLEGGDVPMSIYTAQQQQAAGIGPDGQPMGGAESGDMANHPLNELGSSILDSLGIKGGDEPGMAGDPDDQDDDDADSDLDTDVYTERKAFGANRFEEEKHKRDHGKFSTAGGSRGAQAQQASRQPADAVGARPLSPQMAKHPAVVGAIKRLAQGAASIAQQVNLKLAESGMTPEDLIGSAQSWQLYFATQHADALAQSMHVDTQTAFAVLSHLAGHGLAAIKRHLKSGKPEGDEQDSPPGKQVARPAVNGDTQGDPATARPRNPGGAGSLPNRLKAIPTVVVPELEAFLETLV